MLGIVAPDGRKACCSMRAILPRPAYPSSSTRPGLLMFSGNDHRDDFDLADVACFNDYEAQLACRTYRPVARKTGAKVKALVVTRGGGGLLDFADGQRHEIPCVKADEVVDPTGCGDAYRSGLLYGIAQGWNWRDAPAVWRP